jgi:hypothetical protein
MGPCVWYLDRVASSPSQPDHSRLQQVSAKYLSYCHRHCSAAAVASFEYQFECGNTGKASRYYSTTTAYMLRNESAEMAQNCRACAK